MMTEHKQLAFEFALPQVGLRSDISHLGFDWRHSAMASRHLLNPLAPLNQPTPSQLDGVPKELERDLRACEYL